MPLQEALWNLPIKGILITPGPAAPAWLPPSDKDSGESANRTWPQMAPSTYLSHSPSGMHFNYTLLVSLATSGEEIV